MLKNPPRQCTSVGKCSSRCPTRCASQGSLSVHRSQARRERSLNHWNTCRTHCISSMVWAGDLISCLHCRPAQSVKLNDRHKTGLSWNIGAILLFCCWFWVKFLFWVKISRVPKTNFENSNNLYNSYLLIHFWFVLLLLKMLFNFLCLLVLPTSRNRLKMPVLGPWHQGLACIINGSGRNTASRCPGAECCQFALW